MKMEIPSLNNRHRVVGVMSTVERLSLSSEVANV